MSSRLESIRSFFAKWDRLSPLWTDKDILEAIEACNFEHYEEDLIEPLLHEIRDEYEAALDLLRAEIKELQVAKHGKEA